MHYGHQLEFGTFITSASNVPDDVVALAQRSEALGYDLVTFQDHPYQPALLDTWTLLSWVAGRTERIHLAANVLNVPLRSPAVLARAAASLDLFSGGRLDLALGAGAFWDAIAAMGGQRLTAGQSIKALHEAIDIIRGLWDVSTSTPLEYNGEFYQVHGAQRGPMLTRDIPIWLGAYKPRMQRLIGAKADGWLPSLPYMQPGDLARGNAIIDAAAQEAGRDPREIRRLLNIAGTFGSSRRGMLQGPSEQWVEELLPLVVEDGVSTLILASDDERTMAQFAQEVVPALREAVARELTQATPQRIRPATIRAKRRAGIDYDNLPSSLGRIAVEPGDVGYARVKSTYARGGAPGIVFNVTNTAEIADALLFARTHAHLPLAIRSGGHGFSGRSTNDGGIVINLGQMNTIEIIDEQRRRVRLGPGARWMDVARALEPYGWALSSGDYGGVGVGGLATAGGIGWLSRKHGLTIDHLRSVEMVLADGSVVRADDEQNRDLFWAVRGAGANFGIVTSFEFEVDEIGDIGWAQLVHDASNTAQMLHAWGAAVEAAPRDLTSFLMMGAPQRGQPATAFTMTVVDSDDPDTIIEQLQPVAEIAPLYEQRVVITSYANVMANAQSDTHNGQGEPHARSGLIDHLSPIFAKAAAQMLRSGAAYVLSIRSVGGAVSDVPADATAYASRRANFSVTALGANPVRLNRAWDELLHHFEGLYLSFDTDQRPERITDAFPKATLERLRMLKRRYDPDNMFRDNFNITPEAVTG